jgi:hypothetical protein
VIVPITMDDQTIHQGASKAWKTYR